MSTPKPYIPTPGGGDPCAFVYKDGTPCGLTALPPNWHGASYPVHTPPVSLDIRASWRQLGGHEFVQPTPTDCERCHTNGGNLRYGKWSHELCPRHGVCLTVKHSLVYIEEEDSLYVLFRPDEGAYGPRGDSEPMTDDELSEQGSDPVD